MQTQRIAHMTAPGALPPRKLPYYQMPRFVAAGNTMCPTINPGDDVWVDMQQRRIDGDGIYRIGFRGLSKFATFARVKRTPRGIKLTFDNKRYRGEFIPTKKITDVRVLGRVVLAGRFV